MHDSKRRKLVKALGAGAAMAAMPSMFGVGTARAIERVAELSTTKTLLKPVLDGDWWLIGASPDLSDLLPPFKEEPAGMPAMDSEDGKKFMEKIKAAGITEKQIQQMIEVGVKYSANKNEPVDHHLFKGEDGKWHLWCCVRRTSVGRILYHWQADKITDSPWEQTGEMIRADNSAGESIRDFGGEEWIQSPYFLKEDGIHYMFFGGHSTGFDREGNEVDASDVMRGGFRAQGQISLMTSPDGKTWTRRKDENGFSRLFTGPGEARDPCLMKVGDTWYIYYAGYQNDEPFLYGGCFGRTSEDLIHWSDAKIVHRDATHGGPLSWSHECPHVVYRGGYFYLFRTENYYDAITHVYRSEDPLDFGVDTGEKYVTTIACAAPEIYVEDGVEYVSSNHDPGLGTQLCRLKWVKA